MPAVYALQVFLGNHRAFWQAVRTTIDRLADQQLADTIEGVVLYNTQLVIQILTVAAQFIINDGFGTLVARHAFTGEDLHINHGTDHARRHAQRRIFYV